MAFWVAVCYPFFMELIIPIALIIFIAYREYSSYKERGKLLDRIMSKDFTDYKEKEAEDKEDKIEETNANSSEDFVDISFAPETIADDIREEIEYGSEKN